jgi:hypothetical protein
MQVAVENIKTLDDLRRFVHEVLCSKENLMAEEYGLTEKRMVRGGQFCGLQFCVRGPRSVRLTAIWTADQNVVYLYDAKGVRYAKIRLTRRAETGCQAPAA